MWKGITVCVLRIISLFVYIILLSGCANVAISGAQAVYNRHTLQNNINDQYITIQSYQAINNQKDTFKDTNISITTLNGDVLLTGQAPTIKLRLKAEDIIKNNTDANHIYNLITINAPSSLLTRVSDAWLTTKVKSKLMASNDVDARQVKVMTENSVVYLMGTLKPEEAKAASEIANETEGVIRVVKIFSYLQIIKA